MKKYTTIIFFLLSILYSCNHYGQKNDIPEGLNTEQKVLLKNQRELMIENREKFKTSLTPEQLNILESKDLPPKAKHKALMASLNESQKELLFENLSKSKNIRDEFRNTLTDEQKEKLRKLNHLRTRNMIHPPPRRSGL